MNLPNVMTELCNGDQSTVHLGELDAITRWFVISLDKVGNGQEVRDGVTLSARKVLDLLAEDNADSLKERLHQSILVAKDDLTEQRVLLSSLVAKKQNVRHIAGNV